MTTKEGVAAILSISSLQPPDTAFTERHRATVEASAHLPDRAHRRSSAGDEPALAVLDIAIEVGGGTWWATIPLERAGGHQAREQPSTP
jgi:hypothetical protein